MLITRRHAMRLALGGLGVTTAFASGLPTSMSVRPGWAQTLGVPGKTLIKIFMRGGCDGLYLTPPYGDNFYRNLRPTVAIDPPNDADPNSAIPLNGMIGFNPNLLPWMELWDQGLVAVSPATHYPDASRSHFDSQRWIEQGGRDQTTSGYLNRYVGVTPGDSPFRTLGVGGSGVPDVLKGAVTVPGIGNLDEFQLKDRRWCSDGNDCQENQLLNTMTRLYGDMASSAGKSVDQLTSAQGLQLVNVLEQLRVLDAEYEVEAGGLEYSGTSVGRGLEILARGIKSDLGIEVAALDWGGGWDSHSNQRPRGVQPTNLNHPYNANMRRGVDDILTFCRDLGPRLSDVLIIIGSEFGRTSRQNGSNGTDHGNAATWVLIGGPVRGGVVGDWPGLAPNQLNSGRYLEMAVNYKDLVCEALARHLGMPDSLYQDIFPGHTVTDMGVLRG